MRDGKFLPLVAVPVTTTDTQRRSVIVVPTVASMDERASAAEKAIRNALPRIREMMMDGETEGRHGLHIVVLDRTVPFGHVDRIVLPVLAERSVGADRDQWKHDFHAIALSKARISWRTGRPTAEVPLSEREAGDTKYWGSVVYGMFVVAVSGFQPYFDRAVAGIIAADLRGMVDYVEGCEVDLGEDVYGEGDFIVKR